jgi:hypothetical protein
MGKYLSSLAGKPDHPYRLAYLGQAGNQEVLVYRMIETEIRFSN